MTISREFAVDALRGSVANSMRLLDDAFKVSSITRAGLIELSAEEITKGWFFYFLIHPESHPKEDDHEEKIALTFRQHVTKIEGMQNILTIILARLSEPGYKINPAKLSLQVLRGYQSEPYYLKEEKQIKAKVKRASKYPEKWIHVVKNLIRPIISVSYSEIENLKKRAFYLDRKEDKVIEPAEPRNYEILTTVLLYTISSYSVLSEDSSAVELYLSKTFKDRNFTEVVSREAKKVGIEL